MMMWNEQKIRKGLEELWLNMKRHAMLQKELDAESFDPNHPAVKQEQVNPPVLYETMRLQHPAVKKELKEELMETTPMPFQSLIQHQSPSPIQHPC